ncbi:peptide ABC transporter substrate-binding protein [Pediococcus parvulus]|uniref:peptide ABC transporter substrate-binding protein n=1 Tax=Pediococcus parvulus TaxID=54062 RepID=UPI00070CFF0B|nr:peptide ABC transporter substrate-binding protein [Pediococcus parvulus]MCT3027901.1 peptide ABC transporter substrate-binding protein [Pediococcus parvulus]GEL89012.1 ABC transporter substrate-binding protein [Pediococcus parvulus]GHC03509.1 ABC transporter substrate-binding protein [Pediococcus parvulus]
MKIKKRTATILAVVPLLLLAACGNGSSASISKGNLATKQVVNWTESSELPSIDPSLATDEISFNLLNNTNEGLYRLGKNNKIEPGMATKTTVSKDGKTYKFTLRKNAKWSNGDSVTAQDFVYSWQRINNPKTGSQYAYLYSGVKNADQIQAGKKAVSTLGIKATGKYKLTVKLDKAIPYFKLLMGFPSFFPQDQKVAQKYGSKYATQSKYQVYNGPFTLQGWTGTNNKWSLVKNKKYWDKKHVTLTKINDQVVKDTETGLNQFQGKQVDQTAISGTQVANLKNSKSFFLGREARNAYLEYNYKKIKAFRNLNIRQAMSLAINRKQLVTKVLADGSTTPKGFVTDGLASNPKTGEDFAKEAYNGGTGVTYNLKEAKKLWAKGLKQEGKKSVTYTLMSDDTDVGKKTTEFLQKQLEKLPGLKINVENIPYKTRLARSAKGQFQLVVTLWGADFSDPISDLGLFTSTNSFNNGKWGNKEYDKLIDAANNGDANNTEKRWEDMVKAEKLLMSQQANAPLYNGVAPQLINTKVKGYVYNTAGVPWNWKGMYVTK